MGDVLFMGEAMMDKEWNDITRTRLTERSIYNKEIVDLRLKCISKIQISNIDECVQNALISGNHIAFAYNYILMQNGKTRFSDYLYTETRDFIQKEIPGSIYENKNGLIQFFSENYKLIKDDYWIGTYSKISHKIDIESLRSDKITRKKNKEKVSREKIFYTKDSIQAWFSSRSIPSRDIICQIGICLGLNAEKTNRLLLLAGYMKLYESDRIDRIYLSFFKQINEYDNWAERILKVRDSIGKYIHKRSIESDDYKDKSNTLSLENAPGRISTKITVDKHYVKMLELFYEKTQGSKNERPTGFSKINVNSDIFDDGIHYALQTRKLSYLMNFNNYIKNVTVYKDLYGLYSSTIRIDDCINDNEKISMSTHSGTCLEDRAFINDLKKKLENMGGGFDSGLELLYADTKKTNLLRLLEIIDKISNQDFTSFKKGAKHLMNNFMFGREDKGKYSEDVQSKNARFNTIKYFLVLGCEDELWQILLRVGFLDEEDYNKISNNDIIYSNLLTENNYCLDENDYLICYALEYRNRIINSWIGSNDEELIENVKKSFPFIKLLIQIYRDIQCIQWFETKGAKEMYGITGMLDSQKKLLVEHNAYSSFIDRKKTDFNDTKRRINARKAKDVLLIDTTKLSIKQKKFIKKHFTRIWNALTDKLLDFYHCIYNGDDLSLVIDSVLKWAHGRSEIDNSDIESILEKLKVQDEPYSFIPFYAALGGDDRKNMHENFGQCAEYEKEMELFSKTFMELYSLGEKIHDGNSYQKKRLTRYGIFEIWETSTLSKYKSLISFYELKKLAFSRIENDEMIYISNKIGLDADEQETLLSLTDYFNSVLYKNVKGNAKTQKFRIPLGKKSNIDELCEMYSMLGANFNPDENIKYCKNVIGFHRDIIGKRLNEDQLAFVKNHLDEIWRSISLKIKNITELREQWDKADLMAVVKSIAKLNRHSFDDNDYNIIVCFLCDNLFDEIISERIIYFDDNSSEKEDDKIDNMFIESCENHILSICGYEMCEGYTYELDKRIGDSLDFIIFDTDYYNMSEEHKELIDNLINNNIHEARVSSEMLFYDRTWITPRYFGGKSKMFIRK